METERIVMLQVIDNQWKDHLLSMDELKQGIGNRAYGQKDPLVEYKKESYELFTAMMDRVEDESVRFLFFLQVQSGSGPVLPYPDEDEQAAADAEAAAAAAREAEEEKNNLPDLLMRWEERDGAEHERPRTAQSFCVPRADIAAAGYDLSLNRYREVEHEEVEHDTPAEILANLRRIEEEIAEGMARLEEMLG